MRYTIATFVISIAAVAASGSLSGQAPKTVNDSVYSEAQAARGQAIFESTCTACHDAARFTGGDFMTAWTGKSMGELFKVVSTTMPEDNPGALKPQQYADVLAYFLKLNEFPAGSDELKGSAEAMNEIKIDKKGR
jgi:S-disulfanyl-L-cysteine oxidoreductase SoxD